MIITLIICVVLTLIGSSPQWALNHENEDEQRAADGLLFLSMLGCGAAIAIILLGGAL